MAKKSTPNQAMMDKIRQRNGFGGVPQQVRGRVGSAMPFKATGHKGGISRQGSKRG
ncbi:hypothetical protein KIH75_07090 [Bifidobacterium sp. 64T4]|uniref:hypothetical protein n=1 Tax=Bifidobacterium pongonis TaxID=2834432 RepID=UPI001C58B4F8|nr:hypothetical protein [Bifidobacterium pongonis]MBW3095101.1 hypothetical protein [Bifidobacterium pongonis]